MRELKTKHMTREMSMLPTAPTATPITFHDILRLAARRAQG